ncbi:MAG: hypothetical protein MHPSP_004410, partial [Paramarteilia canceri]
YCELNVNFIPFYSKLNPEKVHVQVLISDQCHSNNTENRILDNDFLVVRHHNQNYIALKDSESGLYSTSLSLLFEDAKKLLVLPIYESKGNSNNDQQELELINVANLVLWPKLKVQANPKGHHFALMSILLSFIY